MWKNAPHTCSFLPPDDKRHDERGVELFLGRQELFQKSISASMRHHYHQLLKHTISCLWLFCLLGIFLWGESQATTWGGEEEGFFFVVFLNAVEVWYFKSSSKASVEIPPLATTCSVLGQKHACYLINSSIFVQSSNFHITAVSWQ